MREFALVLTEHDLSIINEGLQEVRMRLAAPLVAKINEQIASQHTERPRDSPAPAATA